MTFPTLASLLVRLVVLYHFNYSGYRWRLLRDGRRWRSPSFSIASRSEERFSRNAETDLVCRLLLEKKKKAEATRREIGATSGAKDIDIIVGDLSSLTQVRQMAETVQQRHPTLDLLINNAGIMAAERTLTGDGYESGYQVNYLSHFLLTHLLLDALKNSEQGRIINLGSSVY